jgi:hypothetical protein
VATDRMVGSRARNAACQRAGVAPSVAGGLGDDIGVTSEVETAPTAGAVVGGDRPRNGAGDDGVAGQRLRPGRVPTGTRPKLRAGPTYLDAVGPKI